jgi:hypothetical protein
VLRFPGNNSRRLQMRWSLSGKFAALLALSGTIALLQTGCTTEPTSADTAVIPHDGGPAFVNTLSVFGPDSITATGNYRYTAYWSVVYPQLFWYTRTCSTLTVASCTGTWAQALDVSYDGSGHYNLTRHLIKDCTGGGTKSFQNKVVGSGFGIPAQTVYKVTKLCGVANGGV